MKWNEYKKGYLELCEDEGIDMSDTSKETKLKQLRKLWENGFALIEAFERLEDD